MQRKEINDTLFRVKRVSCFAKLSEKNHIFSNYAIVNTDDGKIIASVPDSFNLISNEELLSKVHNLTGLPADVCYSDGKTFHFITDTRDMPAPNALIRYGFEVINTYDGHAVRQVNIIYYHIPSGGYIFTGISNISGLEEPQLRWIHLNAPSDIWVNLSCNNIQLYPVLPSNIPLIPSKYQNQIPQAQDLPKNRALSVLAFAPLSSKWQNSNFLQARKFSIRTFQYYYNS